MFKADIYHYFDTVDHEMLMSILEQRIKDQAVLWLVKIILKNYHSDAPNTCMPLGNWTSQFFANIYLNELDQFVKRELHATYYIRYVDDFVVLDKNSQTLQKYESRIKKFLLKLKLQLHPNKCKITRLNRGTSFLGFRIFQYHKLVRQRNIRKIRNKINLLLDEYENNTAKAGIVLDVLQGWNAYAMQANTYQLRTQLTSDTEQELVKRTITRKQLREATSIISYS